MQSIYDLVTNEFSAVNDLIFAELRSHIDRVEDISQYLVASGGKRVRPLVTLLTAGALGDITNSKQIKLATAIEFLHTATLLHDDVVDMSTLRRGKPTANANWGNASSVLVGDFVYSKSFQLMVAVGNLPVMQVLSATTVEIAEGEVQQLVEIGNVSLDETVYFEVIQRKTAQLFAGACESAAIVANAKADIQLACQRYGLHLGLAFQLVDDYLDYAGDPVQLGKNVGDDLAEGKLTLPLIHALKITSEIDASQHQLLLDAITNKNTDKLTDVIEIVQNTGALQHTLERARLHIEQCQQQAKSLTPSDFQQAMIQLGERVLARAS